MNVCRVNGFSCHCWTRPAGGWVTSSATGSRAHSAACLKKKRRERGEGEVDARPRYRRRAVVTCASDRRPRGGGGGVVVRKRETHKHARHCMASAVLSPNCLALDSAARPAPLPPGSSSTCVRCRASDPSPRVQQWHEKFGYACSATDSRAHSAACLPACGRERKRERGTKA